MSKVVNNTYITDSTYEGQVGYSLLFNNTPLKTTHNGGTKDLQKAFAMIMSNNLADAEKYIPAKFDVYYQNATVLHAPVQLSGSRYDMQEKNWVAIHNCVLDASDFKTTVPENQECVLKLMGPGTSTGLVLAECIVNSSDTINLISRNVSGLITWVMRLRI